jgi:fusion protein PurCD
MSLKNTIDFFRKGKVRDLYNVGDDKLLIVHTDRVSSFDRDIAVIPGKGHVLAEMTYHWFKQTADIIPNHVLGIYNNFLLVKKCVQIPIEFIVRGYITGNTKTSLWTHYSNGSRTYCDIQFPDGLTKNQKLEKPVVTPTTKGGIGIFADSTDDDMISYQGILEKDILTSSQLDYVYEKCRELFSYGQKVAHEKGLILVDTKYEFGIDNTGNIILIDEVHTCDSSRYWEEESYSLDNMNPVKLDKDAVRDYIKSVCPDPYNSIELPEVPKQKIQEVFTTYKTLFNRLNESKRETFIPYSEYSDKDIVNSVNLMNDGSNGSDGSNVIIVSGSETDNPFRETIITALEKTLGSNVNYELVVLSAHKNTQALLDKLTELKQTLKGKVVVITIAGRSNALSGVVACNTPWPVFACPPFKDKMDMMVNINSTLQMPSNTPVMTVLEPGNLAIAIHRIIN